MKYTMNRKELTKRILVSVFGIPILFAGALIGKWFFLILIDIIIAVASWEFYNLAEKAQYRPQKILGIFGVLTISWDMHFHEGHFTG